MPNPANSRDGSDSPSLFQLQLDPRLDRAIRQAADKEMTSRSEIVRRGALKIVREIGIDPLQLESAV